MSYISLHQQVTEYEQRNSRNGQNGQEESSYYMQTLWPAFLSHQTKEVLFLWVSRPKN